MKTRHAIFCLLAISAIFLMGFAPQQHATSSPRKIMNEYRADKGFISFSVPMWVARIFIPVEDREVRKLLCDIHKVRLLVCDDAVKNSEGIGNCIQEFMEYFTQSGYIEIMQVKDGQSNISINALPGKKSLRDMILILTDDDDFAVIHLKGTLDMESLKRVIDGEV
jgi:hypothetical protein